MSIRIKFDDKEKERLELMLSYERELYSLGAKNIAGIDEVGRGPLSGPVVTSAVILPQGILIPGVNDSKKLSEAKRNFLFDEIKSKALAIGIGIVSEDVIDQINILNATKLAMKKAVENLPIKPDYLLIDAIYLNDVEIPQKSVIKGDAQSLSIAAASVIAKVTRDRIMIEYDKVYPGYGFAKNKGYGTSEHILAIKKLGLTEIHRKSFVKNFVESDALEQ